MNPCVWHTLCGTIYGFLMGIALMGLSDTLREIRGLRALRRRTK